MDNNQIPPVVKIPGIQVVKKNGPTAQGQQPNISVVMKSKQPEKNSKKGMIIMSLFAMIFFALAVLFVVLFMFAKRDYNKLSDEVDLKIEQAVSEGKTEQALADAEEAKKDTRTFTGPSDYGQISFDYPKTWSVYVASDARKGGDFVAYLNPIEVEPVSESTVYALRVTIRDKDFESVAKEYQRYLERGELKMQTITVDGATANRYTGKLPNTDLNGVIVIFKIRDKTAVLRTDSALLVKDFDTVLSTVKFNA